MKKNKGVIFLLSLIIVCGACSISYALPYTVIPKVGTTLPRLLVLGNTVTAFYTITNNTQRTLPRGFVKYLPPNVSQAMTDSTYPDLCGISFTLQPGASCTLKLVVAGAVDPKDPNPHHHLFICSPNVPACAGTNYPLKVKGLTPTLSGTVQSGAGSEAIPLANAEVTIYRADLHGASVIARAVSNAAGKFYLYIPDFALNGANAFYAVARKGARLVLATVIGQTIISQITINEMTTVGAAFSMAQFFHGSAIFGKPLGLKVASGMNDNLVSQVQGSLSSVIKTSPNADQTNTMRSLNDLANLTATCVRNLPGACMSLFHLTTVDGFVPETTLDALLQIAHYPAHNVAALFAQSHATSLYQPSLVLPPDAWALAVKFNNSGSLDFLFGGPAKTVFDENGYAWISNNVVQGTPDSSNWIVVLKPNGQPADGSNGTPTSPVFGGGLLGTAFGISIDHTGHIWVGNFGWGSCPTCIPEAGSVSVFSPSGVPVSGSSGYITYTHQVQGTVPDHHNNIWMASYGNDRVVVYLNGDPNTTLFYQQPAHSGPFDVAIAPDGSAWVTNTLSGRVSRYVIAAGHLVQTFDIQVGSAHSGTKGIAFDSQGHAWVAATGDSAVYKIDPTGSAITPYTGGGIAGPWGITVDGADNVWVANFQDDSSPAQFQFPSFVE